MSILGNPITLGGGGSKVPDYTYTGNAEWYNEEKTILKLKTSGVLTLSKDCYADVFVVGGGGGGNGSQKVTYNYAYHSGGGGGGGHTKTQRVRFEKVTEYQVIIGAGGTGAARDNYGGEGGTSSLNGVSAEGGKSSNRYSGQLSGGGYGGSGGGSGYPSGQYSHAGFDGGSDGSNGLGHNVVGVGQGTTTRAFGEPNGELFAGGGGSGNARGTNYSYVSHTYGKGGIGGGGDGGFAGGGGSFENGRDAISGNENSGGGGGGGCYGGLTESSMNGAAGGSGVILIRFA